MLNQQLHTFAYCHDNQAIAQQITQQLKQQGIRLEALDCPAEAGKTALWQGMQNAQGKSILLLTDNFLKSQECMTGALAAIARLIDSDKLVLVVADGQLVLPGGQVEAIPTHFERVSHVIPYMNHWQNLYLDLRRERRLHDDDTSLEQRIEVTKLVSSEIGEFLRYLRNQPSFTAEEFLANNCAIFRQLLGEELPAPAPPDPTPATQPSLVQIIEASSEELITENLNLGKIVPEPEQATQAPEADLQEIPGMHLLANIQPPTPPENMEQQAITTKKTVGRKTEAVSFADLNAVSQVQIDNELEKLLQRVLEDDPDDKKPSEDDLSDPALDDIFKDDEAEDDWEQTSNPDEALLELTIEEGEAVDEMTVADRALEAAVSLLEDGQTASGLSHLKEAVGQHSDNVTLRYYYAYALARYDRDYKTSAEELQTLIQQAPHHPDANFLLGELAEMQEDVSTARRYFEEVANSHPTYPNIYFRLGMLTQQYFRGQEELAAGFFKKAIEQNDQNAEAHYQLANLLHEMLGEPHEAVYHFKKTLAYQPEHPFANYDIALIYHQMGERELAWKFYQTAAAINDELQTLHNDAAFRFEPSPHIAADLVHSWDAELMEDTVEEGVFGEMDVATELEDLTLQGIAAEADLVMPEAVEQTGEAQAEAISENEQPVDNQPFLTENSIVPEASAVLVAAIVGEVVEPMAAPFNEVEVQIEPEVSEIALAAPELISELEPEIIAEVAPEIPELIAEPEPVIADAPASEIKPPMHLAQVVLITGATSGIGKATAEIFAKNGYQLILTGRREERLEELKHYFTEKFGVTPETLCFDVRDLISVKAAISNLPKALKNVDILINNAGLSRGLAPIHEGDTEHWETMIDTNVKGLLYLTRVVAPGMVERRSGHIVNVASSAGKEVYPGGNVYCASKFAVDALTKSMRLDLFQHNVRVSQVAPGHVEDTEFAKVRFDGDEERAAKVYENFQPLKASDVAEVIYFIATRPAHVNIQDVLMFGTQQAGSNFIDRSGR